MGTFDHTISGSSISGHSRKWIERLARFGFAAKGAVYVLVGILAVMAALEMGGNNASKNGAMQTIFAQPFGQILAGLVVVGILGYVLWRFVQAFRSTGSSKEKKWMKRARYALSGLIYLAFAISIIGMLIGSSSSSGGGSNRQQLVAKVLQMDWGYLLVAAAGIGVMIAGIWQWVRAYKEKYMERLSVSRLKHEVRETIKNVGKVGYVARGIVWLLIGFFLLQAGLQSDASEAQGSQAAFQTIEQWGGSWVLVIVALGVVAYGVFMFVKAKYYQVQTNY